MTSGMHEPVCHVCRSWFITFALAAIISLGIGIWELTISPVMGLLTLLLVVPWCGLWARFYLHRYLGRSGCGRE